MIFYLAMSRPDKKRSRPFLAGNEMCAALSGHMKTRPPPCIRSRFRRSLTVLIIGCMCLILGWTKKERLCSLVLLAARRLAHATTYDERHVPAAASQVALVPGTSIHGSLLRQRVETAARLYHAGLVSHLILSGDGRSASYHEPHAMRGMLRGLGVPGEVMTEDPAGLSTYESIQRAGQIAAGRRLVIVTQELHAARALLLARGLGVDAVACALPSQPERAGIEREEKACVRAILDLVGFHRVTEEWEQKGRINLGLFNVALRSSASAQPHGASNS